MTEGEWWFVRETIDSVFHIADGTPKVGMKTRCNLTVADFWLAGGAMTPASQRCPVCIDETRALG